ncbi:MAG: bifunctional nuclease family protein [bacterium]|nr:bifunctional nuclease family protein [bacterium]
MEKQIEVKLVGLILDPISKSPFVILKPLAENKIIPICIGEVEASAITMEMENVTPPRPMTHDLIKDILFHLESKVDKVVINDVVDNLYYAELYVKHSDNTKVVDCRPSDAISLALKNDAKIFISECVYSNSVLSDFFSNFVAPENHLESWFNSLSSEDFGFIEQ